jgi:hypothetical protein
LPSCLRMTIGTEDDNRPWWRRSLSLWGGR